MPQSLSGKTLKASIIHAPKRGSIDCIADTLISIDDAGRIRAVVKPEDAHYAATLKKAQRTKTLITFGNNAYLLPGFIDLHIHAPQWPQLGKALDVPLEDWLQKHTFPLEARYQDVTFATRIYDDLVQSLLAHGTTTAVYFATIHQEATRCLADICLKHGQRAFIGKVAMDDPSECPVSYRDIDAKVSIEGTASFIDYVQTMKGNDKALVSPVITPRFIPSCSDEALDGLGLLAERAGVHVQTHCSESDWEHGYVRSRCGKSDTEALDGFGLMTRKTVLAHGNFLSDSDMELIAEKGAGIAHCPLSNYFFSNAVFPLRRALEKSVRVGLGTDISGGPSASMFDSCRSAIGASRALEEGVDASKPSNERGVPGTRTDFREALYLATKGGADVLDINTGSFEQGRLFDAIVVDTATKHGKITIESDQDTLEDIAQKIIMLATRTNIIQTIVNGIVVHDVEETVASNSSAGAMPS